MAAADAQSAEAAPLLVARGLSKTFPGVRALADVDFDLRAGEIHALLGENGAGKSTLIKLLTGVHRRDAGTVTLAGSACAPRSPLEAQSFGISTVYQEINLIPHLSAAENIYLGRMPRRWGAIRWRQVRRGAAHALARLGVTIDVARPLSSHSVAVQQLVAIARALGVEGAPPARVLILDEPTASLDAAEVARLFDVLRHLRSTGLGIIFVTHFLDQVYALSDRITVLRNGRLVGTHATSQLPRLELVAKMLGQDVAAAARLTTQHLRTAPPAAPRPLLRARGLGRRGVLPPLDLHIDPGESLGLAGLLGSGRTETARLLFGLDRAQSGQLEWDGRPLRRPTPRAALRAGLGFCPEDRQSTGIVPALSVRENIIIALQARRGWLRRLSARRQRTLAAEFVRTLRIATPDLEKPVGQLSGGNQQKVILARWLAANPRLLIVDEPTRGIDVGAKAEIESLLANLCERGVALLYISSELEEVVRNCHRVIVLRDRHKVGELAGDALSLPAIMSQIAAAPGAPDA